MSAEQAQLLMVKGAISDLPEEEKELIEEARVSITEQIDKYNERIEGCGNIALSLVALEFAIKAEE